MIRPGGEEQGGRRASGSVVAESQRPDPVNKDEGIIRPKDEADELFSEAVKGGDPAATEIADESERARFLEEVRPARPAALMYASK